MPISIQLHRVLRADPKIVFKAFVDAGALAKWLPPRGFMATVQHIDARAGGSYAMSFTTLATGETHSWKGTFVELVPEQRLVIKDRFDDPNMPGEMTKVVTFKRVSCGTELTIDHSGIPDGMPPESCVLGWQDSLTLLAHLVETKI